MKPSRRMRDIPPRDDRRAPATTRGEDAMRAAATRHANAHRARPIESH
jgi:hypothetical protein